jgi:phage-related protein
MAWLGGIETTASPETSARGRYTGPLLATGIAADYGRGPRRSGGLASPLRRQVREFIAGQSPECQAEYQNIVDRLEHDGYLVEPYAKKVGVDLLEIRVRRGRQVRVLYFYHRDDLVFGVHAFVKKTQRAPKYELDQAARVVRSIRQGDYDE